MTDPREIEQPTPDSTEGEIERLEETVRDFLRAADYPEKLRHEREAALRDFDRLATIAKTTEERAECYARHVATFADRADAAVAALATERKRLQRAVGILRSNGHGDPGFHLPDCSGCVFLREIGKPDA